LLSRSFGARRVLSRELPVIHGIGIDIVQLARIRDALARYGRRFLDRIFCPAEVEQCDAQGQERVVCYAVRFAAKEAAFKAFRDELADKLSWHDFEVETDAPGVPSLKLSERATAVCDRLGITRIALSLSTTAASACAIVIAEK